MNWSYNYKDISRVLALAGFTYGEAGPVLIELADQYLLETNTYTVAAERLREHLNCEALWH